MTSLSLDFKDLRDAYGTGTSPGEVVRRLYPRIAAEHGMFITLLPLEELLSRCRYTLSAKFPMEQFSEGILWRCMNSHGHRVRRGQDENSIVLSS